MIKRLFASVMAVFFITLSAAPVGAITQPTMAPVTQVGVCGSTVGNLFGLQPWYACLQQKYGDSGRKVQFRSLGDLLLVIFPVVDWLVKIAMYTAIAFIFYMLFKLAMARGDTSKIAGATGGIRDAIIGLVIALVSVGIVNFIANGIAGAP